MQHIPANIDKSLRDYWTAHPRRLLPSSHVWLAAGLMWRSSEPFAVCAMYVNNVNSRDITIRIVISGCEHFLHAWRCSAWTTCSWSVSRPPRVPVARRLTAQREVMLTVNWTVTLPLSRGASGKSLGDWPIACKESYSCLYITYLATLLVAQTTKQDGAEATAWICIPEVLGCSVGRITGYPD
jgi:hypothetical protein